MTVFFISFGAAWLVLGIMVGVRVGITLSIKKKPNWPGWLVFVATIASGIFWPAPVAIYSYLGGRDQGWW